MDVTHARVLIRIVGEDTAKVMSKLCGIDFSDKISPHNTALRTSMAGLVVEIVRNDLAYRSPDNAGSDANAFQLLNAVRTFSWAVSIRRPAGRRQRVWHRYRRIRNHRFVII